MHHYITVIQYTNRNNYLESAVFKSWWTLFALLCSPCLFSCAFGRTQPLFSQHWRAFVSACTAHSWEYLMLMTASGSCTQRAQWCGIMGGGGEHLKESWGGRNGRGNRLCLHRELSKVQLYGEMAAEELRGRGMRVGLRHSCWIPERTSESLQNDTSANRITLHLQAVERKRSRTDADPEKEAFTQH